MLEAAIQEPSIGEVGLVVLFNNNFYDGASVNAPPKKDNIIIKTNI